MARHDCVAGQYEGELSQSLKQPGYEAGKGRELAFNADQLDSYKSLSCLKLFANS